MGRIIRVFDFDHDDISVDSLVEVKDVDVIYEIVKGIFYGIASGAESVDLFEIRTQDKEQVFSISKKKWSRALEKCMGAMIEIEDYETCAEIKKSLNILSK